MKQLTCLLLLLTGLGAATASLAQTRYISDELYVPLRSGQGNEYRIVHRGLRSGTALDLLQESEDGEWAQVATANGIEGWIRTQYLQDQPIAEDRLASAQEQLRNAQQRAQSLAEQVAEVERENAALNQQLAELRQENERLDTELAEIKEISSDAVNLHQQQQELVASKQMLETRVDALEAENQRIKNNEWRDYFIYGVAAVILGALLAVILPLLKPRKRSEWA